MTLLKKCRSCRMDGDCEIQDNVRAAVRGLGVYSLLHRCTKHEARYRPGQAVWAFVMDAPYVEYEEGGEPCRAWFPGHFISVARVNTRGLVTIPKGAEPREQPAAAYDELSFHPLGKNGVCKVSWSRIEPRDAPDVEACRECGNLSTMVCDWGAVFECPRREVAA